MLSAAEQQGQIPDPMWQETGLNLLSESRYKRDREGMSHLARTTVSRSARVNKYVVVVIVWTNARPVE